MRLLETSRICRINRRRPQRKCQNWHLAGRVPGPESRATVNTHLLIDSIVQQTMVFIAQLATAGGVRAPLAHVADQVFLDLTRELQNQGVTKKVIADMFGM